MLVRKKSLAEEIAALDVMAFKTMVLPMTPMTLISRRSATKATTSLRWQKMVEREYRVPEPQTAQEFIGYYARRIAEAGEVARTVRGACAQGQGLLRK